MTLPPGPGYGYRLSRLRCRTAGVWPAPGRCRLSTDEPLVSSAELEENGSFEDAVRTMIRSTGDDPDREGLLRTPTRVREAWRYLSAGYARDPLEILRNAVFQEKCNEMVLVREIELYSLCEHHLLPFFGKCHVAYLPSDRIVGLSKLARVVDVFARRLQVQERLTSQIAQALFLDGEFFPPGKRRTDHDLGTGIRNRGQIFESTPRMGQPVEHVGESDRIETADRIVERLGVTLEKTDSLG